MSGNLVQFLNQYVFDYTIKETGKNIQFKPITTGQIKSLLMYENSKDISAVDKMLDELILGCVTSESFDLDELTVQDRFDLLLEIRKKSKGDKYSFTTTCPKCKLESINGVNLSELEVKPYPKDINKVVKLTDTLSVELDFVRRGIQKEAYERASKDKTTSEKKKLIDITACIYALSMKKFITPQGEITDSSLDDKLQLLDALDSDTYDIINKWYSDNDYGIVFRYKVKCSDEECGWEKEREIPITSFFS